MEINIQEILDIEDEIGQDKFGQSYEKLLRTNLFPVNTRRNRTGQNWTQSIQRPKW